MGDRDDIEIAPGVVIPAAELQWSFTTSGGPGGQHANRSATRAEVRFDVAGSPSLDDETRTRLLARLAGRAPSGVVIVTADDTRSQWRNRALARRRLAELLTGALERPRTRRPTRPTRSASRRRMEQKRARGEVKRLRRRPDVDE